MTAGSVLAAFDRPASRQERFAIEVGRAVNFSRATYTNPDVSPEEQVAATVTVMADHCRRLASRHGEDWADRAKAAGLL